MLYSLGRQACVVVKNHASPQYSIFPIILFCNRTTIPDKALEELLPQLKPVVFWMSNCLEMLPFLQANMSQFIKDPLDLAVRGDDVLVNADEELLMFLEEVVIYTFQQTVYHLTKVNVQACKVTLYCNSLLEIRFL